MSDPVYVEQWDLFELGLNGPTGGNPFIDVTFGARFQFQNRVIEVNGFYDGQGVFRVRFMPDTVGQWRYVTYSNVPELDGTAGTFTCTQPGTGNYGPVRVHNTFHFVYADGREFRPIGTICYRSGILREKKTIPLTFQASGILCLMGAFSTPPYLSK